MLVDRRGAASAASAAAVDDAQQSHAQTNSCNTEWLASLHVGAPNRQFPSTASMAQSALSWKRGRDCDYCRSDSLPSTQPVDMPITCRTTATFHHSFTRRRVESLTTISRGVWFIIESHARQVHGNRVDWPTYGLNGMIDWVQALINLTTVSKLCAAKTLSVCYPSRKKFDRPWRSHEKIWKRERERVADRQTDRVKLGSIVVWKTPVSVLHLPAEHHVGTAQK